MSPGKHFSQAVQDLFGGDGMVEDRPLTFEGLVRLARLVDKLTRKPRKRRRNKNNPQRSKLLKVQLVSLWKAWKSQRPDPRDNEEQFAKWCHREWPKHEFRWNIETRSLARKLKDELKKQNGPVRVRPTPVPVRPSKPAR
jgi:hypothetical protein